MSAMSPRGGGWRVGWHWKLWLCVGEWFRLELGLGQVWLFCGRLTIMAVRVWRRDEETRKFGLSLTLYWRDRPDA